MTGMKVRGASLPRDRISGILWAWNRAFLSPSGSEATAPNECRLVPLTPIVNTFRNI